MACLNLVNINKIYDNNVQAVFDFNLEIKDKEFIVFVGPSGCGKSTTLRMVAGLEEITSGDLYIDGELVNSVEPMNRGIAMVFQTYALYPHMTVYKNMAFSLKMRKFPVIVHDAEGNTIPVIDKAEIRRLKESIKEANFNVKHNSANKEEADAYIKKCEERIAELEAKPTALKCVYRHMGKEEIDARVQNAAKILGLTEYLQRKPAALSGGQRQRVALGRAIVRNPKVFLMDEPLSNLDAKLRVQMRSELKRIHKAVGATTIYVTHDQTEAMTMADRIVVMKAGHIQQIATPKEIYNKPANLFVATFIGSPAMNILEAEYDGENALKIGGISIPLGDGFKKIHDAFYQNELNIQKERVASLEEEIAALFSSKGNAKAVEQRQNALSEAKRSMEFSENSLKGEKHALYLGIRPENVYLSKNAKDSVLSDEMLVQTLQTELLGQEVIVYSTLEEKPLLFKISPDLNLEAGSDVKVVFDLKKINVFDYASGKRIDLNV